MEKLPIRKALFTFLLLPFASCFFVLLPFDGFWYIVTTYGNCLDALDFFMQDSKLKKMMMGVSSVGFAAASFLSGKTRPKVPSQTLRVWPIHGHIQIWWYQRLHKIFLKIFLDIKIWILKVYSLVRCSWKLERNQKLIFANPSIESLTLKLNPTCCRANIWTDVTHMQQHGRNSNSEPVITVEFTRYFYGSSKLIWFVTALWLIFEPR